MTDTALPHVLSEIEIDPKSDVPPLVQRSVILAKKLQTRAGELQTPQEKRQQSELERMMQSPSDKATLMQLTDQAFRSSVPSRAADQLTHILDVQGVPRFFSTVDRAMLKGFQSFGSYLPGVSMPMVTDKMRAETANVVLPAEKELLRGHLTDRRQHGLRMNVNFLGEALLGEGDAERRLEGYLEALQLPELEVLSVKVSTIYSQILPIARERAVKVLCDRMELLYRAAANSSFTRSDGEVVQKFVYLDMEEYRDLWITVQVFTETLDRRGLENVNAGIALQAYVPDSYLAQEQILAWAKERVAKGGAPVTIRLVKGANMEMERVDASIHGWPQAPYQAKVETDANYKRMLQLGLHQDNIDAVRIGVASHNLFEIAYALVLAEHNGVLDKMQFEMLEGMANHQRRALCELTKGMLLYAPATQKSEFINAIGYLVRRLDENTGDENFLRHAFKLEVDSPDWRQLEAGFVDSFDRIDDTSSAPRRTQDRRQPLGDARATLWTADDFDNEPDTDFSLEANQAWARDLAERWQARHGEDAIEIPLVFAGETVTEGRAVRECVDPSRPGVVVARYLQASTEDIERTLTCATDDPSGWRSMSGDERGKILTAVAHELRAARGDMMGAATADGGKIFTESDPEISEAIDFVEYYGITARAFEAMPTVDTAPKGVIVVVPPWNFPVAIPCGGIAAGLAAGNTVILKPASDTVLVAFELVKCFWRAGVPKEALQFVPCSGAMGGAQLVASEAVGAVILTGGTDTGLRMIDARPRMNLLAETGGKNATIVTSMSDREQAIKHVLHSAFSHCGQKCSATSLLILEGEVYDDPTFKETLCDAVRSLKVGTAWNFDSRIGPLVRAPDGDLERGLKVLEDGETWAVLPRADADNPQLWSPGVKYGVKPNSYTHLTEFFGPVLGVMRADNLQHAIDLVNATGYGLTSGIESLDDREVGEWRDQIRAGNLYINRGTTGAIVERQPFGGMGKSAFGPGIKAGGPSYVAQLMDFTDKPREPTGRALQDAGLARFRDALKGRVDDDVRTRLGVAIESYDRWNAEEFSVKHDRQRLVGQDNFRRYLPVQALRVRVEADDSVFEIFARVCAARAVGCRVTVSRAPGVNSDAVALLDELTASWAAGIEFVEETDEQLAAAIAQGQTERVRYAGDRAPEVVLRAVGASGIYIARSPVLAEGRIELLWYVKEQAVSVDYHRYGNLSARADEERKPVA